MSSVSENPNRMVTTVTSDMACHKWHGPQNTCCRTTADEPQPLTTSDLAPAGLFRRYLKSKPTCIMISGCQIDAMNFRQGVNRPRCSPDQDPNLGLNLFVARCASPARFLRGGLHYLLASPQHLYFAPSRPADRRDGGVPGQHLRRGLRQTGVDVFGGIEWTHRRSRTRTGRGLRERRQTASFRLSRAHENASGGPIHHRNLIFRVLK
jgi:hypothetical protein